MGLFKKEPPEKKAYWKAFGAMMKKPNAETFAAMEEACRAWPEGWQGYLFMALAYDVACAKIPFDPEKGAAYHKLAKEAGKKAEVLGIVAKADGEKAAARADQETDRLQAQLREAAEQHRPQVLAEIRKIVLGQS